LDFNQTHKKALKSFAERIKHFRKARGLTQEEMVKHGFSYRHYQRLESGNHSPSFATLVRLAMIFKVPPSKLL
jgi:transcriptional regulator with XRE-family HTH domain